jgi:hypothetical protein
MIGKKLYKENINWQEYADCAEWCTETQLGYVVERDEYYEVVAIPPHVPTAEEIQKMLTDGVQAYMDTKAQERGYDNIHTACSYANSTDEVFKAEGTACLAWRDSVWRKCYNILDEVKTGKRAIPTFEEVIAALPVLAW